MAGRQWTWHNRFCGVPFCDAVCSWRWHSANPRTKNGFRVFDKHSRQWRLCIVRTCWDIAFQIECVCQRLGRGGPGQHLLLGVQVKAILYLVLLLNNIVSQDRLWKGVELEWIALYSYIPIVVCPKGLLRLEFGFRMSFCDVGVTQLPQYILELPVIIMIMWWIRQWIANKFDVGSLKYIFRIIKINISLRTLTCW